MVGEVAASPRGSHCAMLESHARRADDQAHRFLLKAALVGFGNRLDLDPVVAAAGQHDLDQLAAFVEDAAAPRVAPLPG